MTAQEVATLRLESIEERLRDVRHAIELVLAICAGAERSAEHLHPAAFVAMAARLEVAGHNLTCVERLPSIVLNLPAPADDQLRAMRRLHRDVGKGVLSEARLELVEKYLRERYPGDHSGM